MIVFVGVSLEDVVLTLYFVYLMHECIPSRSCFQHPETLPSSLSITGLDRISMFTLAFTRRAYRGSIFIGFFFWVVLVQRERHFL